MLIQKVGLNLEIKDTKGIKNLLRIGQIVEADVVEQKGNLKYLVKIKGNLFEAYANIPLTSKRLKLTVKQLSPQIILKIVEQNEEIVNFVKYKQPIIIDDENLMIEEAVKILKEAVERDDRLKAVKQITKLSSTTKSNKLSSMIKNLEEKLIKERTFDKEGLENLIGELSKNEKGKDKEKLAHLLKEGLKNLTTQQTESENLFVQIPLIINSKQEEIYIKKDSKKEAKTEKSFKITMIWKHKKYGTIQIDGLYTKGTISCNLFFSKESAYELFLSKEGELKTILNGINLSLNLMKKQPIFNQKHINIKI